MQNRQKIFTILASNCLNHLLWVQFHPAQSMIFINFASNAAMQCRAFNEWPSKWLQLVPWWPLRIFPLFSPHPSAPTPPAPPPPNSPIRVRSLGTVRSLATPPQFPTPVRRTRQRNSCFLSAPRPEYTHCRSCTPGKLHVSRKKLQSSSDFSNLNDLQ